MTETLLVRARQLSSHPLASAVTASYSAMGSDATPDGLRELPGNGLFFTYQGENYRIGSRAFVWSNASEELDAPRPLPLWHALVYYGTDDRLMAVLVIEDELRPGYLRLSLNCVRSIRCGYIYSPGDRRSVSLPLPKRRVLRRLWWFVAPRQEEIH